MAATLSSSRGGKEADRAEKDAEDEKPKLLKPMRKSISNSELMLD